MDLNRYWRKVRAIERSLPGGAGDPVYLVSLANETSGTLPDRVTSAEREYAARWIAGGTHRLATAEETERCHAEIKARTDAILKAELEKKQTVRLETAIPQEQLDAAVAKALEGQSAKTKKKETL